MSCSTPNETITAYVDGELDVHTAAALERHLGECRDCAGAVEAQQALRAALRDADLRFRLPAERAAKLRRSLGEPQEAAWPRSWRRLLLAAALAGVALGGFGLGRMSLPGPGDPVEQGIVASHVRSLLGEHLVDIATSDRHAVKPWFNGRLDYAVPVLDLAADGFALRGGRLDYFAGERVAALVYQSDRHTINLFVRPEQASGDEAPRLRQAAAGYQLVHWRTAGMGYWAISDLEAARLEEFVRRFREREKASGAG